MFVWESENHINEIIGYQKGFTGRTHTSKSKIGWIRTMEHFLGRRENVKTMFCDISNVFGKYAELLWNEWKVINLERRFFRGWVKECFLASFSKLVSCYTSICSHIVPYNVFDNEISIWKNRELVIVLYKLIVGHPYPVDLLICAADKGGHVSSHLKTRISPENNFRCGFVIWSTPRSFSFWKIKYLSKLLQVLYNIPISTSATVSIVWCPLYPTQLYVPEFSADGHWMVSMEATIPVSTIAFPKFSNFSSTFNSLLPWINFPLNFQWMVAAGVDIISHRNWYVSPPGISALSNGATIFIFAGEVR